MAHEGLTPSIWSDELLRLYGAGGGGIDAISGVGAAGLAGAAVGAYGSGGTAGVAYMPSQEAIYSTMDFKLKYFEQTGRLPTENIAQIINYSSGLVAPRESERESKDKQPNLPPGIDWGSAKREIDL